MSQQEIVSKFQAMRENLVEHQQKIAELESERSEHTLVIEALEPLDGDRKCFRLIGGVLVERTVKEVLPALKQNRDGIGHVIEQMTESYQKKEADLQEFKTKHNIQIRGEPNSSSSSSSAASGSSAKAATAGVLV